MKRVILADVPNGAIVRIAERWGVKCVGSIVDFWDGGREAIPAWTVVELG